MATLPPGAPGAPNPAGNEPGASPEAPRWAAPAVPPPWAGTGQPTPAPQSPAPAPTPPPGWAQPGPQVPPPWAQPGYPAAPAARPTFDREKWLPTLAVAAVIAAVVLGGIGMDKVVAAPSAGTVQLGSNATMTAPSGWVVVDTGDSSGVTLQKANTRVFAAAGPYQGSAQAMLAEVENGLRNEVDQIAFGTEQTGTLNGHEAAMVGFEAVNSGASGGTLDGEAICIIIGPDGVLLEAVAPVGMLDAAADDIKAMATSIEVRQ
jgi:hypothetical protein